MAELGVGYLSIMPEVKGLKTAIAKELQAVEPMAQKQSQSTGKSMMGGIATGLKAGALATGAAAGGALALAMGKGFGRLSNIDQAQAKLRGLGHDANSVSAIMESANAAVKGTAFGLDEAASTAASAVAAGIQPGKDLERTLKLMGDAATIAGTDMGTMGSIVNKVATSDMMQMDVANQLMDAGIPILQMVGKEMGVTAEEARKMASEGKINFETFQNALEDGLGGAALESGNTFKGSLANMQAALGRFGAKLLEPVFKAAPPVFEKIGEKLDEMGKVAGPIAEKLAGIVGPIVVGAFESLLGVVDGVVGALKGVFDFGQRNQGWILPMAGSVTVLAGAFGLLVAQQKLMAAAAAVQAAGGLLAWMSKLTAVTKIQTAAQTALNLVMNANPIFLLVTAIAAVAAGLYVFFTRTETGRRIWENFTQAIGSAWDWVKEKLGAGIEWIKTAFSGLKSLFMEGDFTGALRQAFGIEEDSPIVGFFLNLRDTVMQAFDFITAKLAEFGNGFMQFYSTWIQPVVGFISESFLAVVSALTTAFQFLGEIVTTVWTGAIVPAFQFLGQLFTSIWTGIIQPALSFFMSMLTALGQTVMSVVQAVIVPVWNFLGAQISNIYNNLIQPIFGFFRAAAGLLADVLTGNFSNIRNRFTEMGQSIANIVRGVINAAMETFKNIVRMVGDAWNNFKGVVANVVSAVSGKVQEMVGKITAIPGKIQSAFASAGSWLRNAGTNLIQGFADGIRAASGWIVDAIKSLVPSQLHHFLPFMDGGFFFANGGTTEKHEAQIARAGAWRVWAEPETGGEAYIPMGKNKRKRSTQILATVADRFGMTLADQDGNPVAGDPRRVNAKGATYFADGGITGRNLWDFLKGRKVRGYQASRPLEGAPYIWGGGHPNWGDCSGTVSTVAAFAVGQNPAPRRFATGSEASWLTSHGFKRGRGGKGDLRIGMKDGGPGGGHTSGTLPNGVNFEMGGARGNGQLGGGAAGAWDSYYNEFFYRKMPEAPKPKAQAVTTGALNPDGTQTAQVELTGTDATGATTTENVEVNLSPEDAAKATAAKALGDRTLLEWGADSIFDMLGMGDSFTKKLFTTKGSDLFKSSDAIVTTASSPRTSNAMDHAKQVERNAAKQPESKLKNDPQLGGSKPKPKGPTWGPKFFAEEIARQAKKKNLPLRGAMIGLATALVESGDPLKMWANRAVPESLKFRHDAVGSDHDSIGLFQQRQAGWGTVKQRMTPFDSAGLFYNAMLKKFPNWQQMEPGAVAQGVQVSAFPYRYATKMARAKALAEATSYFDRGGIAPGVGFLAKNTIKPERVLSPQHTRAFDHLVFNLLPDLREVSKELKTAYRGGDWGYGTLNKYLGDSTSRALVNGAADAGVAARLAKTQFNQVAKETVISINVDSDDMIRAGDIQRWINDSESKIRMELKNSRRAKASATTRGGVM